MEKELFSWVPFYQEMASKLLGYKNKRKELLDWIYSNIVTGQPNTFFHYKNLQKLDDVDPFTIFGLFNRGGKEENRLEIVNKLKKFLKISAPLPRDFSGIPILHDRSSHFFNVDSPHLQSEIQELWNFLEIVLDQDDSKLASNFDKVYQQPYVKDQLTMALFWIEPNKYIALDKHNIKYFKQLGIVVRKRKLTFAKYESLIKTTKSMITNGEIPQHNFLEFSRAARFMDKGKMKKEQENPSEEEMIKDNKFINIWKNKKNIIIYGAPGTGKTYEVPQFVVELCNPSFQGKDRTSIIKEYNRLIDNGRVVFTTFHQSLDYEDFIEGLKPVSMNGNIDYQVEDGLFKKLCKLAATNRISDKNAETTNSISTTDLSKLGVQSNAKIWKISLMGAGENELRKDCFDNNRIRFAWNNYGPNISKFDAGGQRELNAFINKMQKGDVVLSCFSETSIDAIGIITGDYDFNESFGDFCRVRPVKWLIKNIRENILELNEGKVLSQQSVYQLKRVSLQEVQNILNKYSVIAPPKINKSSEPYVLIIDEINRGNVSKVFGELITLLESDKRLGEESEVRLNLPYSKDEFGVPENVFVIATMNTADRSLGNLDYAVRRRFAFVPLTPKPLDIPGFNKELFKQVSELFVKNYEGIFSNSEKPIPSDYLSEEFEPTDVWVGHSYFLMKDKTGQDQTANKLKYEIIPILREYIRDGVFKDTGKVEETIKDLEKLCS